LKDWTWLVPHLVFGARTFGGTGDAHGACHDVFLFPSVRGDRANRCCNS
jgi:hypothetical protein